MFLRWINKLIQYFKPKQVDVIQSTLIQYCISRLLSIVPGINWYKRAYTVIPVIDHNVVLATQLLRSMHYMFVNKQNLPTLECYTYPLIDYFTHANKLISERELHDYILACQQMLDVLPTTAVPHLESEYNSIRNKITHSLQCLLIVLE